MIEMGSMYFQGLQVSPEDYTPLWGWITFDWVYPLIKRVSDCDDSLLYPRS